MAPPTDPLVTILLAAGAVAALLPALGSAMRGWTVEARLRRLMPGAPDAAAADAGRPALRRGAVALGGALIGRGEARATLARRLALLGFEQAEAAALFAALRWAALLLAGLLGAGLAPAEERATAGLAAALLAFVLPGAALSRLADGRERRLRAELPDAIDILAIALESGAGTEQALRFSAGVPTHPAARVQSALRRAVTDLDRGTPYDRVLERLGERLAIAEGRLLVEVLRQSLMHGTEILPPLRELARDLRARRVADARNAIGRATTLMTLVMVLCLLPALLTLIGAPAVSGVLETLGRMGS